MSGRDAAAPLLRPAPSMIRQLLRTTTVVATLVATASAAQAQVFNTTAPLTGSIAAPNTEAGGAYANLALAWNITQEGNLLRYTYTFSGFSGAGISHTIISLSPNCQQNFASCVSGVTVNGQTTTSGVEFGTFADGSGNPGFPTGDEEIFGVKINTPGSIDGVSPFTVSFLSTRAPVYGDFYVKGGSSDFAYNDGLLNHASNNTAIFIARPDTDFGGFSSVPEPSTYALMGTGLLGLAGIARRRRQS